MGLIASIPSPADGDFDLFGLSIHAYGLMIALGVVAGVWLGGRRLEASGAGTRDDYSSIAMWGVGAGIIGARLYYIVTDKGQPWKEPGKWLKIWEGGLGIPGGLLLGIIAGAWAARRKGVSVPALLTASAPALPLAQAIGRVGNWWNQELYGRPTGLPWGLEISDANLPDGGPSAAYPSGTLFHPTFAYEALWNIGLCLLLVWVDRRFRLRPGRLLAVYVAGYAVGRFWVEGLRIDPANSGGGWRLNQWTAVVAFVLAVAYLLWDRTRPTVDVAAEPTTDADEAGTADEDEDSEVEVEDEADELDSGVDSGIEVDGEYVADDE